MANLVLKLEKLVEPVLDTGREFHDSTKHEPSTEFQ